MLLNIKDIAEIKCIKYAVEILFQSTLQDVKLHLIFNDSLI